ETGLQNHAESRRDGSLVAAHPPPMQRHYFFSCGYQLSCKQRSGAVDASLFLTGIIVDFTYIGHTQIYRFHDPFRHLVLVLEEAIATIDIAAGKRRGRRFS